MSSFSFVRYHIQNRIAFITLARSDKRNALNQQVVAELKEAFTLAEEDDLVKAVVLTGEGDAFCAGADLEALQQMQNYSFDQNLEDSTRLKDLFLKIYTLKKIVIAQVNGPAIAGGCGLATVCDFSFASTRATFGYTEVRIGFIPAIVLFFLIRKIGEGRAKELLLSGLLIQAEQAKEYGLINDCMDETKLAAHVEAFAQQLIKNNSGQSMSVTKGMIAQIQDMDLSEALSYAAKMNAKMRESVDCKKGIQAFLTKQKPIW